MEEMRQSKDEGFRLDQPMSTKAEKNNGERNYGLNETRCVRSGWTLGKSSVYIPADQYRLQEGGLMGFGTGSGGREANSGIEREDLTNR